MLTLVLSTFSLSLSLLRRFYWCDWPTESELQRTWCLWSLVVSFIKWQMDPHYKPQKLCRRIRMAA